jgi:hypothetical protein
MNHQNEDTRELREKMKEGSHEALNKLGEKYDQVAKKAGEDQRENRQIHPTASGKISSHSSRSRRANRPFDNGNVQKEIRQQKALVMGSSTVSSCKVKKKLIGN